MDVYTVRGAGLAIYLMTNDISGSGRFILADSSVDLKVEVGYPRATNIGNVTMVPQWQNTKMMRFKI